MKDEKNVFGIISPRVQKNLCFFNNVMAGFASFVFMQQAVKYGVDPTFLRSSFLAVGASALNLYINKKTKEKSFNSFHVFTNVFTMSMLIDTYVSTGKPTTHYGSVVALAALGVKLLWEEDVSKNKKLDELNNKLDNLEKKMMEEPKKVNTDEILEMINKIRADDYLKNRNKLS